MAEIGSFGIEPYRLTVSKKALVLPFAIPTFAKASIFPAWDIRRHPFFGWPGECVKVNGVSVPASALEKFVNEWQTLKEGETAPLAMG